jgi:hypothetical protein
MNILAPSAFVAVADITAAVSSNNSPSSKNNNNDKKEATASAGESKLARNSSTRTSQKFRRSYRSGIGLRRTYSTRSAMISGTFAAASTTCRLFDVVKVAQQAELTTTAATAAGVAADVSDDKEKGKAGNVKVDMKKECRPSSSHVDIIRHATVINCNKTPPSHLQPSSSAGGTAAGSDNNHRAYYGDPKNRAIR